MKAIELSYMSDEILELLDDILTECSSIKEFISDHTFDTYKEDKKTRFAVERCFEIIGVALTRIGKIDESVLTSIRDHRGIKSFRNILDHAYDHVEDEIVWGIIERDLDNLIEDIEKLK